MSERKRLPMTAWYDPVLLLQTGIRVAISTVFGQFADKREAIAAANAVEPQPIDPSFDYSAFEKEGDFWIDFLADTGDGWDSTYAMAQLVTDASLRVDGGAERPLQLPRGRVLVLGGDQVYPTASRAAYDERFLGPFDEAHEKAAPEAKVDMPDLYALPGNHDWYDGLGAFFNIFCRRRIAAPGTFGINRPGRKVAGRPTRQTRSYYALQLREDWWLWAMDSQLEGSIDQPQIDYFQYVASQWMKPRANVILCVGQPNWAYVNPDCPERQFETFSYLERLAGIAQRPLTDEERKAGADPKDAPLMGHKLRAVLTGDSHHYSRFVEQAGEAEPIHYITCGGGGAFLHPTHHLTDRTFDWDYPAPGVPGRRKDGGYPRSFTIADKVGGGGKALFPDAETSRALTRGNRRFALDNKGMTLVFVVAYLLFNWLLNANARVDDYGSLVHALTAGPIWQAPLRYIWMSFATPWPVLLFGIAMAGYYYFADSPDDSRKRLRIGLAHGLFQAGAAVLVTSLLLAAAGHLLVGTDAVHGIGPSLLNGALLLAASAAAGLLAATVFGAYLTRELDRHGRHWNEAFSSLAIPDFKCFLRMKIDAAGDLHIYPVGLKEVPRNAPTPVPLSPHLIEGPIVIRGERGEREAAARP